MEYPDGMTLTAGVNGFSQTLTLNLDSGVGTQSLLTNASYHPNGLLATANYSNGQSFSATQNTRKLPHNWKSSKTGTVSNTLDMTYHYDSRNNVSRIDNYFSPYSMNLHGLQYDGLNRLKSANGHWGGANYGYDKLGNITNVAIDGYMLNYSYGSHNRLNSVSTTDAVAAPQRTFSYDANGNVTNNGSMTMTYDEMNQMLTANSVGKNQTNTYDGNHHRGKTAVTENGQTKTTYSIYSSGNLLHEYDLETGERRNHVYLNGQSIATLGTHNDFDTNGDGIPDYYERLHGLDAEDSADGNGDADGDGISNRNEYELGGLAMSTDGDNDGLPDSWEREYFLNIGVTDGASEDADGDGISNINEYVAGTNPSDHTMTYTDQMYLVPVIYQQAF